VDNFTLPTKECMDKGHKIDLTNYKIVIGEDEVGFNVRTSLVAALFHPGLELTALTTRRNDKIAVKVEECKDDHLILNDEDYGIILNAVDTFTGYDRNAVEFIRRVQEAEEIEVEVKEA